MIKLQNQIQKFNKKFEINLDIENKIHEIQQIFDKYENIIIKNENIIIKKEKEKNLILENKGNKGEKGEISVIKTIFNLCKNNDIDKLTTIFGNNASDGIIIYNHELNKPINNDNEIKNSTSGNKADFVFKFIKNNIFMYCSIKCEHGAMPAILNHTPRSAKVFQKDGYLFSELNNLDNIITYFNNQRKNGNVGEDIYIKNMNISKKYKQSIIKTITYFLFDGTGSGISKCPSNSILEVIDPNDINKWNFYNCNNYKSKLKYSKSIYNRIVISMRDKGMPKNKNILCYPWIFFHQKENNIIKEKGSLHIRLTKSNII